MSTEALWGITLAVGLVVAVVAWVLLHLFYVQVKRIEDGSARIWMAGKGVARNTATTWQLGVLSADLDDLTIEALHHDTLLRSGLPTDVSGAP